MPILENIKILDLTRVVSGPWATQIFADMGATVYKVEPPGEGDSSRQVTTRLKAGEQELDAYTALFLCTNRGKQSLEIDIATPEGAALVKALAAQCDVFVENFKAGGLAQYGLDYEAIRAINPGIVYCSISGFGVSGPYATRPAYDFVLQGMAGLMSTCGLPDDEPGGVPMRTGIPMTDIFAGLYGAVGVLAALLHKQRTGVGQFLDVGMLDVSVAVSGHLALEQLMTGKPPGRHGNASPIGAPADVFVCRDGHLIILAGINSHFQKLADVLGRPEWLQEARFGSPRERFANRHDLNQRINVATQDWLKADLVAALGKAGVPAGPIHNMAEVFQDPQVQHRDLALTLQHPQAFPLPSLRNPLRFSATPVQHDAPPLLGEHTDTALTNTLGLDAQQLARLREAGVIGQGGTLAQP